MNTRLPENLLAAIKKFNYDQLHNLNHIIVERLNLMERSKTLSVLKRFQIFDSVYFIHKGKKYEGVITRLNQRTTTVKVGDSTFWKVSPNLLKKSKKKNILKELILPNQRIDING